MRRIIFLFLDGVGLGEDDPATNPLAVPDYPTLNRLLAGNRPVALTGRLTTEDADLIPTDARMGVSGRPQSATGQATIVTGFNAPRHLGEHYGPRPDARVRALLDRGSIFKSLQDAGKRTYFANPYPHGYFTAVKRGKRLLSAIPYAVQVGGQPLLTHDDLVAGRGIAADFTNRGWVEQLNYGDVPVYTPRAAGGKLWEIAQPYEFLFFEHWMTDLLGHRQARDKAVEVLGIFDEFLGGLLDAADLAETLIIVGSDHGNVEDCSHGKHTENPAFTLLLGAARSHYAGRIQALTDFVPVINDFLGVAWPGPTAGASASAA